MNEGLQRLHLKLLKAIYKNRGISPNNWLEVLQSLLAKRRSLEAEWTAVRNFYGISDVLGDDDEMYDVPTLDGVEGSARVVSYHAISLENKVCFDCH